MPLIKIFAKAALSKPIPLVPLQTRLCAIWSTKPSTTKLMLTHVSDWTEESFKEDVYVDVRAKATPERTREAVFASMAEVAAAFADHGLVANVRLVRGSVSRTCQSQPRQHTHSLLFTSHPARATQETYEAPHFFHLPPKS